MNRDIKFIVDKFVSNNLIFSRDEFVLEIKKKVYPSENINFIDTFLKLLDIEIIDDFIMDVNDLGKYHIFPNCNMPELISIFDDLYLVENKDYIHDTKTGAYAYKLTPTAFKLCLFNSNKYKYKSSLYFKYYLFVETCTRYFYIYEKLMMEKKCMKW